MMEYLNQTLAERYLKNVKANVLLQHQLITESQNTFHIMLEIWEWRGKLSLNDNLNMTSKHIVGLRIGTISWFDSILIHKLVIQFYLIQ